MDLVSRQSSALPLQLACRGHTSLVGLRDPSLTRDFLVTIADGVRSSLGQSPRYRGAGKLIKSGSAFRFCRLQCYSLAC